MKDQTRELGALIQKGVRDCRTWSLGPFHFTRTEFHSGPVWGLQLTFGGYFIQLGGGRRDS